jgi:lipopolysaccharide biosynthesis glycosyltransferase
MIDKDIHIVCTIDDAYIQHCAVLLASLFVNYSDEHFSVYIITDLVESPNLTTLKQFLANYPHSYSIHTIDRSAIRNAPITHHISLATYFRLFIPKILPSNLDRVLFLDVDMVIRNSIRSLWEIELEGYTHAAAIAAGMDDYPAHIGLPSDSLYFNAGLMLINLQAWRELEVFERGCELIHQQPERLQWWDQDVLNILLHNAWKPINLTWNAQPFIYSDLLNSDYPYCDRYSQFNYIQARNNPTVVHFVGGGSAKPWHYHCQHPFKQDYLTYLKTTPWCNTPPVGQPDLLSRLRFQLGLGSKARQLLRPFWGLSSS